ncbi:MAG: HAD family hydrolase [Planctomycetes bacterium]|nr:HAD family hydrolase [Planctomycetota bacterium]
MGTDPRTRDSGLRTPDSGPLKYDVVLYDHDGTLVNSLPVVVAATNAVLVRHGFPAEPPQVVIDAMVYATTPRMGFHARGSDPALHPRLAEEFYAEARRLGPLHATAYDGVVDLLATLAVRGVKQGIISNNQGEVVRIITRHLGILPHLAFAWGEDDVSTPKPAPDGIRQAAEKLGVPLDRVLFVGDSENDSEAAQAAGVACVGVTWGIHSRAKLATLGFDHLIDHPRELLPLIV